MANWRFKGRSNPQPYASRARGVCDRCQFVWDHFKLQWEMEYRGNSLMRTGFLVCPPCLDVPYQGRRPVLLPADPVPILNPRTEPLLQEENSNVPNNPYWDQGGLLFDDGITVWEP